MRQPIVGTLGPPLLRTIPEGFGRVRLANRVYRRCYAQRSAAPRTLCLRDGSRFTLDLGDWPQAQAFLLREYDPPTVAFVAAHLPPGGVFVDAGAHVGLISFQVLRRTPTAHIHAFEPHPHRNRQYATNLALNNARHSVTLNAAGLSNLAGSRSFDLSRHAVADGSATIPVLQLDHYMVDHGISRIDILKLDVEGHQLQALEGASCALMAGRITAITLEASIAHGDVSAPAELLQAAGYRQIPMDASWVRRLRRQQSINRAYVLHRTR
jgi:FkbM family methyltransferase